MPESNIDTSSDDRQFWEASAMRLPESQRCAIPVLKVEICSGISIDLIRSCGRICDFIAVRKQEAQLSPRDRAMRCVNWNLANCHATVQKLLIWQVLTKSMLWSWRFSRRRDRQCALNHDATELAPIVSGVINKPTTVTTLLCASVFFWRSAECFVLQWCHHSFHVKSYSM